ncbi:hypothetical protein LshimejAT787_1202620 [Lyophyllum shimeji]|uniref:Uncharacterized protein n=1 Tax=Lyophyllum shimeji TaxID=47721 RepID=A0A9P3PWD6_LYOSH|nr:hypothetical protein LshimejAT787_1202620 [Lyophyllum shimeji]
MSAASRKARVRWPSKKQPDIGPVSKARDTMDTTQQLRTHQQYVGHCRSLSRRPFLPHDHRALRKSTGKNRPVPICQCGSMDSGSTMQLSGHIAV